MEKSCFKCGIVKPITDFYKHKQMGDGHLNKCKECTKQDANNHRYDNIDKVREYDRNRPNKEQRVEKNKERLNNNPDKKHIYNEQRKQWAKNNSVKRNAHLKLARAILNGTVQRECTCSKCGSDKQIEAHHEDYSKPIDVVWLCSKCHHKRHVEIRNISRQKIA